MALKDLWQQWGPQGLFDRWACYGMTGRMAYMVPHTLVPALRMVSGNPEAVDRDFAQVVAQREPVHWYDSPAERARKEYGRFVRELEWVSQQLKKHLSQPEYEALVAGTVARAIDDWIGGLKPRFANMFYDPEAAAGSSQHATQSGARRRLEAKITKFVSDNLFKYFNAVNFMVGPMEIRELDLKRGYMEAYIPECALHTAPGGRDPKEEACVVGCKAGTEAAFGKDSPMRIELEPHLPGLACTMRTRWDPAKLRVGDAPTPPEFFVPEKALLKKSGREPARMN